MNRTQFSVLAAGAFAGIASRAGAQTSAKVTLGTIPIDNGAEAFYAQDQGFFHKAGLDVDISPMNNGGAIVAAVASGALDIGFTNLFSFVTAYSKGIPVTLIAPASLYLSTSPAQALLVRKDSPYKTGKDLNGKVVACDGLKGITQITASAWIDQHGGDSTTVQWIEIPLATMPEALAQNRIAAASGVLSFDPTAGTPQGADRVLGYPYDAIGSKFLASGFIATKSWAAANPALVKRFADAIGATARWANRNQAASGEILMKVAKLTPQDLSALSRFRAPYAESLDPGQIDPVIAFAEKYHIIPAAFPARAAIDPAALH
jgi:ABC-type nitrate/sulfonate/bicarbonate transport system substrate-binding protein